jgi:alkaline phosphatase D
MKLKRRGFLKVAGVAAAAGCSGPIDPLQDGAPLDDSLDAQIDGSFDARAPGDASSDRRVAADGGASFNSLIELRAEFPLGIMAGDATSTSAMFWTQYAGSAPLILRVLEMDGSTIAAVRYDARVTPGEGNFVHVTVDGLLPGKNHRYAFLRAPRGEPDGRSAIGRIRTAIADDAMTPLTFAGACCTSHRHRPFPVLIDAGSRTDLDFFIHAGDHIYADLTGVATTLPEYRAKYGLNWPSGGLSSLHRSTGMYCTWDDHEVANNWNPETISMARLAAARQAYFEHHTIRTSAAAPNRIWRSFQWGRTAEIFILDCRGERLPSTRSLDPANPSQYISRAQMDWLKSGLADSGAVFKFIVNSVPIANRGATSDNWNGYASQRREILRHIVNNNIRGVVWLSGDVHFGAVTRIEPTGDFRDMYEVIMGPAGADKASPVSASIGAQWQVIVDGIHNYTVLRANPTTRTVSAEFIDATGRRIANSFWSHVV